MAPVYEVQGGSEPVAKWKDKSQEKIFSDDDDEKKFIEDVSWIKEDHWLLSEMKWNTIHGVPWRRNVALGSGAWGSVCVGIREDRKMFACKSINIEYPLTQHSKKLIRSQIAEIKMMRYLRSKYIIRCLGCGRSSRDNGLNQKESLDVFLELAMRGSLWNVYRRRKNPFEEDPYIRQYTYDLLKALQYMRKKRVVHGDIKMANVLLGDDCVKLADWGGAKQLSKMNLRRFLTGTAGFRSPEVIKKEQQSYPSDIFSLGCTVIEMFTGRSPDETLKKVMGLDQFFQPTETCTKRVKIPDQVSLECKDFLGQCLCLKIEDRWTAAELLHHPFITNRDKTSTLPYGIGLPQMIRNFILRPPRQLDPELPDGSITKRVYRHLTRASVSQSWVANLAGCKPTDPPLDLPSPKLRKPSPDPLPALAPDFKTKPDENLLQLWPDMTFLDPTYGPDKDTSSSPQHIVVKTPVGTSQRETSGNDRDLHSQAKVHPAVQAKEFHDEMLNSANVMREVNNNIYAEAKTALLGTAAGPPLDDPDHHSVQLFPQLKKARLASETGTRLVGLSNVGLGMGCGSGEAVDAVEPRKRKIPSPPRIHFATPGEGFLPD